MVMQDVWEQGAVVGDWKHAVIVPIPKKGDLKECNNWRGISLLDVAGKLFARIIQERLQVIAEDILPESQCGFRGGRGCTDMIFAARQLVEKCREHDDVLFMLFVDLRKAYDTTLYQGLLSGRYWESVVYHQPCCPLSNLFMMACRPRSELVTLPQTA